MRIASPVSVIPPNNFSVKSKHSPRSSCKQQTFIISMTSISSEKWGWIKAIRAGKVYVKQAIVTAACKT